VPSDPDDKDAPESGPVPAPVESEVAAATAAPDKVVVVDPSEPLPVERSAIAAIDSAVAKLDATPAEIKPGDSLGIDISIAAGESGSIDVALSGQIPKPPTLPDGAVVEAASESDSAPVSSGRVTSMTVAATGPTEASPRSKRITDVGKDMLGKGMSMAGSSLEAIGGGVSKLGEKSKKVPVVGSSVSKLGEGVSKLGESMQELPRVARTRRGALLMRSLLVGFVLVFSWIAIIVLLQVQGTDSPDFRPHAERILNQISRGKPQIEELYEKASPRFQEIVRKERFVDEMLDLNATCGGFLEITAVNESFVSSGPTGRIGRMSTMVQYAHGKTRAAVSLHWLDGEWKLLGVSVEVPPELRITQAQREERVTPCEEKGPDGKRDTADDIPNGTMNTKSCDVHVAANRVLGELRDGEAAKVWDEASKDVFQKQEQKGRFVEISTEQQQVLGEYRRIIAVTEAKLFKGKDEERGFFDVIAEYSRANVRVIFGFTRVLKTDPWLLRSLKIALPMPRIDDLDRARSGSDGSAGSGSGSAGSGSQKAGSGSQRPAAGSGSQKPMTGSGSARPTPRPRPVIPPRATGGSASVPAGSSAPTTGSGSEGSAATP
jgi:hypothetical protein